MRKQYTGMNPAIVDSLVYVGVSIIAADVIHIIVVRLEQRAAMTETKMGYLLVHSFATPLVMLAFFFPFFGCPARLSIYPQYQGITVLKILASGYILGGHG